ncbi:NTP pyrophosphohydrolase [Haloferax sp. Atlit-6N]|uniref:NUDIX family hydrolase n=1 Tax=Haloferax gibbonsii TaxID=35746 RepID=A0A871BK87_HALGI|nr:MULTISPECIES: NUDIX domain-containing protein [Haloferax]QOS13422.1 NUDIX family hydrolase [Haloferax gibbonsii]REA00520.1 NTP pyrophosphohydrolase [Haloferax sp. Atlit-6N]
MTFQEINLGEVERRRDRLFNRFEEAPVVERYDTPEPDEFEDWIALSKEGYIGSAYALIKRSPDDFSPLTESMTVESTEQERVLLILGRGSSEWGVPGGGQENGETMEAAAQREIMEEVGITASLTGINHMRHEIATCEGYDERLHVLRVFFHAEYEGGSITTQPGELNGAAWFVNPPAKARLLPSTQRLLENWNPN